MVGTVLKTVRQVSIPSLSRVEHFSRIVKCFWLTELHQCTICVSIVKQKTLILALRLSKPPQSHVFMAAAFVRQNG